MRVNRWIVALVAVLIVGFGAAGAALAGKSKRTFKNTSAVAANDFKLRSINSIKSASFTNNANGNAFLPGQAFGGNGTKSWDSPVDNSNPVAAGGTMTVESEPNRAGADCKFTKDGTEIATQPDPPSKTAFEPSGANWQYRVSNESGTETILLTDVTVRKNGNPSTVTGPGPYTGGGTLVSSTAGPISLSPGASTVLSLGVVDPTLACSIVFDAALSTTPSDKFAGGSADVVALLVPGLSPLGLILLVLLLATAGIYVLWTRRRAATA